MNTLFVANEYLTSNMTLKFPLISCGENRASCYIAHIFFFRTRFAPMGWLSPNSKPPGLIKFLSSLHLDGYAVVLRESRTHNTIFSNFTPEFLFILLCPYGGTELPPKRPQVRIISQISVSLKDLRSRCVCLERAIYFPYTKLVET